jgi:hypothetical protein
VDDDASEQLGHRQGCDGCTLLISL